MFEPRRTKLGSFRIQNGQWAKKGAPEQNCPLCLRLEYRMSIVSPPAANPAYYPLPLIFLAHDTLGSYWLRSIQS